MEHPQRQYLTRVAQHTRRKIYGGDRIYGTLFPWSDWFQNCFESKKGDPWYYEEQDDSVI